MRTRKRPVRYVCTGTRTKPTRPRWRCTTRSLRARVLSFTLKISEHRFAMMPFSNSAVARIFDAYPPALRDKLLVLRALVFTTAASTAGVGEIEETLKWGEPAYVTTESRSGSTIRIDAKKSAATQ